MSTARQRYQRRKRQRLENERAAKALPSAGHPKHGILSRHKEKGRAAASFATTRAEQYDESKPVEFFMPGVKVRGKTGPAGWRKLKPWYKPENK